MVDVLQNYMQDAISLVRLQRTDNDNHDNHGITDYIARRRATEKQRRRNQNKEQEKQSHDRSLYQLKESTMHPLQVSSKPLNGLACKFCSPSTNVSFHFPIASPITLYDSIKFELNFGSVISFEKLKLFDEFLVDCYK